MYTFLVYTGSNKRFLEVSLLTLGMISNILMAYSNCSSTDILFRYNKNSTWISILEKPVLRCCSGSQHSAPRSC